MTFNKFDLRDYLFNVYRTRVHHVRAFIIGGGMERRDDGKKYMPAGKKYMSVELEEPFVWPDPPKKPAVEEWREAKKKRPHAGPRRPPAPATPGVPSSGNWTP